MEFTEESLRHLALSITQIAFLGGLVGAMAFHFILSAVTALADRLAERTVRAMRIRAARQRSVEAS